MKKRLYNSISPVFYIILCILFCNAKVSAQQAFSYTQYMNNLSQYNPAYASINRVAAINATGRLQWAGIDGAPKSYLLNGSLPFENIGGTAGMIIKEDKFSVENQTALNLFFAKSVQLSAGSFLAVSISGGFQNYKADYSQLDPADPQFKNDISESSGTIGAGIIFYKPDKFYAGVSLPNFNLSRLNQPSTRISNTIYFSGGFLQDLGDSIMIKPAVLVSYVKNIPVTADVSATLYFKNIGLGINYRTTNDIAGILSCLVNNLRFGYSYQAGLGNRNIGSLSSGTHELSFGLYFGKKIIKPML